MHIVEGERFEYSPFSREGRSVEYFHCQACGGEIISRNDLVQKTDVIVICPYCQRCLRQARPLSEAELDTLLGSEGI